MTHSVTQVVASQSAIQLFAGGTLETVGIAVRCVIIYIGKEIMLGDGVCDSECDSLMCDFDAGDCVSAEHPVHVYVSRPETNITSSAPHYISLFQALADVWASHTLISLLPGPHSLSSPSASPILSLSGTIGIESVQCSIDLSECTDQSTDISIGKDTVRFEITGKVSFRNVRFIGSFSLLENCDLDSCYYCPRVFANIGAQGWVDDRGNEIRLFANQTACDQFREFVFIWVRSQGELTLKSVDFIRFRFQPKAVIRCECANLTLENVTFSNIIIRPAGVESAVIDLDPGADFGCSVKFSYNTGIIDLLNNGYELSDTVFSGFLRLISVVSAEIYNVTFQYNSLMGDSSIDASVIYGENVSVFQVANCTFSSNLVTTAIIFLTESDSPSNTGNYYISIANSWFEDNLGVISTALYFDLVKSGHIITVADCVFRKNSALQDSIITIALKKPAKKRQPAITRTFLNSFYILNAIACENIAPYLLKVTNVDEVSVVSLISDSNGDGEGAIVRIFSRIRSNQAVYMSELPDFVQNQCAGTVFLQSSTYVNISSTNFTYSSCSNGSPGLTITGYPSTIWISSVGFSGNQGEELLLIETENDLDISGLYFYNNSNTRTNQAVCLKFVSLSPIAILLRDSLIVANSGFQNTIASVSNVRNFTLSRVVAVSNSAVRTSAGVIFYPYTLGPSLLLVTDCRFEGNQAFANGVISVIDSIGEVVSNTNRVELVVKRSIFASNFAHFSGSCITISGIVFLSSLSVVSDSSFVSNTCQGGGASIYMKTVKELSLAASDSLMSLLSITNSDFRSNRGDSVVFLSDSALTTSRCSFIASVGTTISMNSGCWSDWGSKFVENKSGMFSTALLAGNSTGELTRSVFDNNTAEFQGGAIAVTGASSLICIDCLFQNNSCSEHGGAIDLEELSSFYGYRVSFIGNSAGNKGSALFAAFSVVRCRECQWVRNRAGKYASVFMFGSDAVFEHSVVSENEAKERSPGVMISLTSLSIMNCSFLSHKGDSGSFIYSSDQTLLTISDSHFSLGLALQVGGCLYATVNSSLFIRNTSLTRCVAFGFGNVIALNSGFLSLTQVNISDISGLFYNAALFLAQGGLVMEGVSFSRLQGGAVMAVYATVAIVGSEFEGIEAYSGAAVCCIECFSVMLRGSKFAYGLAKKGGAIYSYSAGSARSSMIVTSQNCTFSHNRAVNGGAIYADSVSLSVTDSHFFNNSVSSSHIESDEILYRGLGGVIYAVSANIDTTNLMVVGNLFVENWAENKGGVMYWFDNFPLYENNTAEGNWAPYGTEIASFPVRLALLGSNSSLLPYEANPPCTPPQLLTISNVPSGQPFNHTLRIALVDQYDHIVTSDGVYSGQIQANDSGRSSVAGVVQVTSVKGVFEFVNVTFVGEPNTRQCFLVSTDGIDMYMKKYTKDPSRYCPEVGIIVEFRECEPGESYQGLSCYICQPGTFSLHPSDPCTSCPAVAICYGGFSIVPKAGYWRPDPYLNLFFSCSNSEACLGSPALGNLSLTGRCQNGYTGNLCSVCEVGYSKAGKNVCNKCPSLVSNIVITSLIFLLCISLFSFAIFLAIRSANRPRSKISIYVKLFVNYFQMVILAGSLDLNWPSLVRLFLTGQQVVGSVSDHLFSIECLLQAIPVEDTYNAKAVVAVLLPGTLIALASLTWGILKMCSQVEAVGNKIIASSVVVIFVLHPSLTRTMFGSFACVEIKQGEYWLSENLALLCWQTRHMKYILTTVLPGLLVWSFGLPTLSLILMVRSRNALSNPYTCLKFSFLYKGYASKWYYWEYVILYRKVALVSTLVFFSTFSSMVQALSVLAVLFLFLFLQIYVKPYCLQPYNRLEVKSILVSLLTIYSGLYFQACSMSIPHAGFPLVVILFVVILAGNSYFLLSWLREIAPILLETLKQGLARLPALSTHSIHPVPEESSLSVNSPVQPQTPAGSVSDSQIDLQVLQSP